MDERIIIVLLILLIPLTSASFGYDATSSQVRVLNYINYTLNGSEVLHNILSDLQGGDVGEYYHLAQTPYDNVNLYHTSFSGFYNSTSLTTNTQLLNGNNYWNDTFATFNKTYADTLYSGITTTYYPFNSSVSGGTYTDTNNITDATYYDTRSLNFTEGNGANPLNVNFTFTGVSDFSQVVIREQYTGSSSHHIKIQLWDYTTSTWQDYFDFVGQEGMTILTLPVYDTASHISGGNVTVRFNHVQNGIASHRLYVDFIWLIQGNNVGASTNLDGYAKYNFTSNNFNGTGNFTTTGYFFGDGSQLTGISKITGAGTLGYIPMWNGTTSLNNSVVYQSGSNVGIGTTNPGAILDVAGSNPILRITDTRNLGGWTPGDRVGGIEFYSNDSSGNWPAVGAAIDYITAIDSTTYPLGALQFKISDTAGNPQAALTINRYGNVGIGTTSPVSSLDINTTADAADNAGLDKFALNILNNADDTNEEIGIGFRISSTAPSSSISPGGAITFERTSSTSRGSLHFKTKGSTADLDLNTRMTIDSAGLVGIGTTSPQQELHVAGNILANGTINATGDLCIQGGTCLSSVLTSYTETDPHWTGNSTLVPYLASANTFAENNIFSKNLTVDTNTLFVDSSTNKVGIGTVSPEEKLHIAGTWASTRLTGDNIIIRKPDYSGGGWAKTLMNFQEYEGTSLFQLGSYGSDNNYGYTYLGNAYNDAAIKIYPDNSISLMQNTSIEKTATSADEDALKIGVDGEFASSIKFYDDDVESTQHFKMTFSASSEDLKFHSDQVDNILYLTESGYVGIGTNSPDNLLHVKSIDGPTGVIQVEGGNITVTAVGEINSQLDFGSNDASVNNVGNIGGRIASVTEINNGAYTGLAFYTFRQSRDPDLKEAMRIDSAGNVGIGTATPDYNLHIYQNTGDAMEVRLQRESGNEARLIIDGNSNSILGFSRGGTGGTEKMRIYRPSATDDLRISAVGGFDGDIMSFIQATGKVGIGTVSPSYPLEVNGSVSDISIYASGNISATGFITRTSVFDKNKNVWDYVKNADYFKEDGKIKHSKFYGYVTWNITKKDMNRKVVVEEEKEVCEDVEVENETIQQCHNETVEVDTYPYTINEVNEGVDLGREVDVLREGLFEVKQENNLFKECLISSRDFTEYKECVTK